MSESGGLHAGDDGFLELFVLPAYLAAGHDVLELSYGSGQHHYALHAALKNARGQHGFLKTSRLGHHVVALGEQVFHGNDLPASFKHHLLPGAESVAYGFLVGL